MLTENSLHLLTEFFKYGSITKIKLCSQSYNWLNELFIKIKNIKKSALSCKEVLKCDTSKYIHNTFIGKPIQKDLNSIKDCRLYTILNTDIIIGEKYIDQINLKHIGNLISIMRHLSKKTNKLEINIWNTNFKKELPHQCSQLQPIHINSGSTLPGEYIHLWRHEELYKVLIHEMIHTFFLDFRDTGIIHDYIKSNYNISTDSPVYIWESYTELLAVIIHSIYISKSIDHAINIISVETYFNYLQCAKLLNHFKCDNLNDLQNNKCILSYKTDVFSYFFIKTSLLHSLNDTIQFMIDHNIDLVKFNQKSLQIFLDLISTTIINKKFKSHLNNYIALLPSITDRKLKKTLRMTCIEKN